MYYEDLKFGCLFVVKQETCNYSANVRDKQLINQRPYSQNEHFYHILAKKLLARRGTGRGTGSGEGGGGAQRKAKLNKKNKGSNSRDENIGGQYKYRTV